MERDATYRFPLPCPFAIVYRAPFYALISLLLRNACNLYRPRRTVRIRCSSILCLTQLINTVCILICPVRFEQPFS